MEITVVLEHYWLVAANHLFLIQKIGERTVVFHGVKKNDHLCLQVLSAPGKKISPLQD